jgi:hypothetical protein
MSPCKIEASATVTIPARSHVTLSEAKGLSGECSAF